MDEPWQAAALGLLDHLSKLLGEHSSPERLSQAFWHACSGGQRRAAECLLASGAYPNWTPGYAKGTPHDEATGLGTQRDNMIGWLREHGARAADPDA